MEILSRPLIYQGEPDSDAASDGRFLARFEGFLDPVAYAPKREITIRGRLESTILRHIGEYPYRYPLIKVESFHLWPEESESDEPWHDPWYSPTLTGMIPSTVHTFHIGTHTIRFPIDDLVTTNIKL